MGLQDDDIIKLLGLQDVTIEHAVSSDSELKIVIYARQIKEQCVCHACNNSILQVHEWKLRKLRGPPLGIYQEVWIYLKQLRGYCHICGDKIRSAKIPFVHPQFQNLILSLCEHAGRLMEEITCEAVSRLLRLNAKTMWDLDQWRMRNMKPMIKLPEDINLSHMSADEVHFRTMPKENSFLRPDIVFVTNLVCYKESKVLSNAIGRSSKSLKECLKILTEPQRLSIHFFAVDMHDPFISVIRQQCPNSEICIDRFHLAEAVNKCFDEVRKSEFKKAREQKDEFQQEMLSPHRRFVLVEREKKLSKGDLKMLDQLKQLNSNIFNGMILVEHFHRILDKTEVSEFRKSLTLWYRLVRESGLKSFRKFAKTIRKYRLNIESYVRSKLTTAVSEGLNNKIKTLKRMAYGYTNTESFLNKILQRCGYLNSKYIDTTSWFWRLPDNLAQKTPF
jgi:transposase